MVKKCTGALRRRKHVDTSTSIRVTRMDWFAREESLDTKSGLMDTLSRSRTECDSHDELRAIGWLVICAAIIGPEEYLDEGRSIRMFRSLLLRD